MTRVAFLDLLGSYNVSSFDEEIDLDKELAHAHAAVVIGRQADERTAGASTDGPGARPDE
jgi:hypothetical protein